MRFFIQSVQKVMSKENSKEGIINSKAGAANENILHAETELTSDIVQQPSEINA
jgi:hypothetical protein